MGRHTAKQPEATGSRRSVLLVAALVVLLMVGLLGVYRFAFDRGLPGAAGKNDGCSTPVRVATTPELESRVRAAAQDAQGAGGCWTYDVTGQPAAQTAAELEQQKADAPDIWIPDSTLWVNRVQRIRGQGALTLGPTIATSPVVLAVPPRLKSNPKISDNPTWLTSISDGVPLAINPDTSSASLVAINAAYRTVSTTEQKQELVQAFVGLNRPKTVADPRDPSAANSSVQAMSEQQLIQINENAKQPYSVVVPREGAGDLVYAWTTSGTSKVPDAAGDALQRQLISGSSQNALHQAGFRVPGLQPPTGSTLPRDLTSAPYPTDAQAAETAKLWANVKKDSRLLVVMDVSGSMSARVPGSGGASRIEVESGFILKAFDTMPQGSQLGVWAFATDLDGKGKDYKRYVDPVRPLSQGSNKKALRSGVRSAADLVERDGDTGLYDTIAAAYDYMVGSYDPTFVNSLVIMTDGKNDDPGGGLSLAQLTSKVRATHDPNRPVKIITIAMGGDADPAVLKQIAQLSNGLSYTAKTPEEMKAVFLDSYARRVMPTG